MTDDKHLYRREWFHCHEYEYDVMILCFHWGGGWCQYAAAGEEHPHTGWGSDEGEDSADAAAEVSAGAGPRPERHPVLHALCHLTRLSPFSGTTGELSTTHRQPEWREGGSSLYYISHVQDIKRHGCFSLELQVLLSLVVANGHKLY